MFWREKKPTQTGFFGARSVICGYIVKTANKTVFEQFQLLFILFPGNTSDKQLTNDCGILKLLEKGDEVMADRGFEIEDDLPSGVSLNVPPFLGEQKQFSEADEIKTRRIAKHRIHVERAIQRIKSFRILKQPLQIIMAADLNKIWVICSYLTLFFRPLIKECEE